MRYLRRLIESQPMLDRIPDQSLISQTTDNPLERIHATRAADGSYAFIYSASGRPFMVHLSKLSGRTITAKWYNPRDGSTRNEGVFKRTGDRQFTPPSHGSRHDWVLVLARRDDDPHNRHDSP